VSKRLAVIIFAVVVKHRPSKHETSKNTELNCFVQSIPDTFDAKSYIEQSGAKPSEPQKREKFKVIDQGWLRVSSLVAQLPMRLTWGVNMLVH